MSHRWRQTLRGQHRSPRTSQSNRRWPVSLLLRSLGCAPFFSFPLPSALRYLPLKNQCQQTIAELTDRVDVLQGQLEQRDRESNVAEMNASQLPT